MDAREVSASDVDFFPEWIPMGQDDLSVHEVFPDKTEKGYRYFTQREIDTSLLRKKIKETPIEILS